MNACELSIVLPCYNEALNIPILLKRYADVRGNISCELILVNNGSTDGSEKVFQRELLNSNYRFARVIHVPENRGYGHGILTGLLEAKGRILAFSHADMQCDAEDVFRAYQIGKDNRRMIVKGNRIGRGLGNTIFTFGMTSAANFILKSGLSDINAQPKVFSRDLLQHLTKPPLGLEFDLYCLYTAKQLGWSIQTIPVHFRKRLHGKSKWASNPVSKMKHISNMVRFMSALSSDRKGSTS